MTNSQRLFADIRQQIAVLRVEISQSGKGGLTDMHKQCENLVKHLLNRAFGYQLHNLNGTVANFEGLDLGDEAKGIAYQVSSERSSAKVDDMLAKVLRYKHYIKYPDVRLFVLGERQRSYAINVVTEPFFSFDWKIQVSDFDDLLKVIQHLDVHQLTDINQFLLDELPYTLEALKNREVPLTVSKPAYLINIAESLAASKMPYYQHAMIKLRLLGVSFATAELYKELTKFYRENRGSNLQVFNPQYRQPSTAQQMDFSDKLSGNDSADYFKESALRLTPNQVVFENASYDAGHDKLTPLITEILALTTLLIFCKHIYGNKPMQVILDFELATTHKLSLIPQNSHLHLVSYTSWPILNPSPLIFSRTIKDISNETFNNIYKEIIHGFVTDHNYGQPFMDLDEAAQNKTTQWFKNYFAPTLGELDD